MSETFHFGKQELALICKCCEINNIHYFRLALKVVALAAPFTFQSVMAVRMKPLEEFEPWTVGRFDSFTEPGSIQNVVDAFWTGITADDSKALINGNLHMRVSLAIKNEYTTMFNC